MANVLGIDLGTQSLKTIIYNSNDKSIIHQASEGLDILQDDQGKSEQKPEWWKEALENCLKSLPTAAKKTVEAIGVSGQQHGLVVLDENKEVIRAAKLWNDTTTQAQCETIEKKLGGAKATVELCGNRMLPGYTAPKILWLKENEVENYQRVKHVLLPHDYINFLLTGELSMEAGDASGTALLDIKTKQWSEEVISAIDASGQLKAALPQVRETALGAGKLEDSFAETFELKAGIPVSVGGGDNMMGAIGTACVEPGKLTISLGTSGTLYAYSTEAMSDEEGTLGGFCDSTGAWLPLLCTMNCTVASEKFRELLDVPLKELDGLASSAPVGSDGLVTLPFFTGERSPNLPKGRACLLGMHAGNTSKAHIMRSAMEAAVFGLKMGLESLTERGLKAEAVQLIGGGSKSKVWQQICADVLEMPVRLPLHEEAAALGAALQALALVESKSIASICREHVAFASEVIQVKNENVPGYREAYKNYKTYLNAVKPLFQ